MTPLSWAVPLAGLAFVAAAGAATQPVAADPFAFLSPWITVTPAERSHLAGGRVVARTLPPHDGQTGVFVATQVTASPERLAAWTHDIASFKRGPFVQAIRRFSEPPVLADLDTLSLDDEDVRDLRHCRPGDCAVTLGAAEIVGIASAAAAAGDGWRDAVQQAFRRVVLARVHAYRVGGLAALPAFADDDPARPADVARAAVVGQSPYLVRVPALQTWLERYPHAGADVESFFYWSKEHYGSGKPVVSVTHVGIVRPAPAADRPSVLVAGAQILSTHYSSASLGLTMIVPGLGDGPSYLVYVNRSRLDILSGMLGSLARRTLERRLARQAPVIIGGLKTRLESGPPSR